jgi:hypothetical protein
MQNRLFPRAALSVAAVLLYGWINALLHPLASIVSGEAAGGQFANSDAAFAASYFTMRFGGGISLPLLVLLGVLLLIWWQPISALLANRRRSLAIAAIALLPLPAAAYYDKNDYTEAYFILPNESAFFIPDVGANKDSQAKFGSAQYLEDNKVAAKRFIIPHAKFSGSGFFQDFYVPTGRLIIVDRTPYNREWTASRNRGTSVRDESFPCQSQEGLNVTAEIAIATSVTEEDAAKFLYWFGVRPPVGNRTDPQVIFASVYGGRSLAEVMDGVGRGKVQSLVCHEIGARSFDKVNTDINAMMDSITKEAEAWFKSRGITLDYIGWAGTLSFDHDVQKAVNDRFTAEKVAPVLPVLQSKAIVEAVQRWDGHLPSTVSGLWLVPGDLLASVQAWLKSDIGAKKQ